MIEMVRNQYIDLSVYRSTIQSVAQALRQYEHGCEIGRVFDQSVDVAIDRAIFIARMQGGHTTWAKSNSEAQYDVDAMTALVESYLVDVVHEEVYWHLLRAVEFPVDDSDVEIVTS